MSSTPARLSLRAVFADTRPLASPHFARLFYTLIVASLGAQITVLVVPAQLFAMTGSSAYVGLAGVFGLLPLVLFGLYGGALADHFDRRIMLMIATVGLSGTAAAMGWQALAGNTNPWILLGLFSLQQAFFGLYSPARTAIIPQLVPRDQLVAANALGMTVFTASAVVGPALGGFLLPIVGYGPLYMIDAVTVLATCWAVWRLPPMPVHGRTSARAPGLRAVGSGLRFAATNTVLAMSFVIDIIAMVYGMPRVLFPQIAHEVFGDPLSGGIALGILMASMPLGAALGGVFSGWTRHVRRQGLVVIVSVLVWGLGVLVCGAAVSAASSPGYEARVTWWLGAACFGMIVGGAADMASAAFRTAILQDAVSDDIRGRLQGLFIVVVAGGPRVADTLHGFAAGYASPGVVIMTGAGLVIVGALIVAGAAPSFRRYEQAPTVG